MLTLGLQLPCNCIFRGCQLNHYSLSDSPHVSIPTPYLSLLSSQLFYHEGDNGDIIKDCFAPKHAHL
jgi:hypothetical protein